MSRPACLSEAQLLGPHWVPDEVLHYLTHTELGFSIREIARGAGCHASTISRQIRRFENRRDDPLVDEALHRLGSRHFNLEKRPVAQKEPSLMSVMSNLKIDCTFETEIDAECRLALRRLAEQGAVLAVAREMEQAVIVRDLPGGQATRTAVVSRCAAETLALRDLIHCEKPAKISRYQITSAGRAFLKRLMIEESNSGFAESQQSFAGQHRSWGEREIPSENSNRSRRVKFNLAESPLTILARRKDKNGEPFLTDDLVASGERLREDFELAQMGPRLTQNWEGFLTAGSKPSFNPDDLKGSGPTAARDRVHAALADLGPGLGDVVLRCCCFLEGMETTEKTMGWSARSGKIVLRIALQRLKRHYEETHGKYAPMIG